jgi:hypothetical protein
MNLWAKRIGQLAALPVALFFFSCEEEANLLGYKNPNPKFDASYVEIPIESSVLLLDSQRTSNYSFENETNRLLVGQYVDTRLGSVSANTYTQYYTNSTTKLPANAVYDSVSIQLRYDFYLYGVRSASPQTISVYELEQALDYTNRRNYFNTSQAQASTTPIGSKTFTVDIEKMEKIVEETSDTVLFVTVPLDLAFGQKIFSEAVEYSTNPNDTTFVTFSQFVENFKGLAIKSDNGNKIMGFSPLSSIQVHYHYNDTTASALSLPFVLTTNFNEIKTDFASGDLAGLSQASQDFYPASELRYIQSGTGVGTKLDLGRFFDFADTVPNVIITSAELSIESVETDFAPASSYVLRLLKDNNEVEKYARKNKQDSIDLQMYNPSFPGHSGTLRVDAGQTLVNEPDTAFYVLGDQNNPYLSYFAENKTLRGNYALFFQQLTLLNESKRRFQHFLITPASPAPNTKSVNRAVFHKDNIKLKIYYTKPTTPLN